MDYIYTPYASIFFMVLGFLACLAYLRMALKCRKLLNLNNEESPLAMKAKLTAAEHSLFFYKNIEDNIEYASAGLVELLEYKKESPPVFNELKEIFGDEFKNALETLAEGNKNFALSLKLHKPVEKYIVCSGEALPDEEGHMEAILLYFNEIKTEVDPEFAIRKCKQEIKNLLDILNNSPYPTWQRNKDGEIIFCNFAYMRIALENREKLDEKDGLELSSAMIDIAKKAIKARKEQTRAEHIIVKGERKLFKITEVPVKNGEGTVGLARDITSEEELEDNLEQYIEAQSNLLESSGSAAAIFGTDTHLLFYNDAYMNLWGLEERWLEKGPAFMEILEAMREKRVLPEQVDFKSYKKEQLSLFTNLIESKEEFMYLPNGTVLRVIVIPYALGGLLFSYEDLTEHITLERKYNTLTAVKRATIDNLQEGIAVFAENGRLELYNPVYADMWQFEEEFLNKEPHISKIIEQSKIFYDFGSNWESFKKKLIEKTASRKPYSERMELTDGTILNLNCIPLPDGATLMNYMDVTDSYLVERSLRAEKEALKEADNLKSSFLSNVSYELRSPLTSIKGFSEVLLKEFFGGLNEKQKEYIEGIHTSSRHLAALINDILDIASIDAGYMTLDVKEFDLNKALMEQKDFIEARVKEHGLKFSFNCPKDIGSMLGDKKRISQVVINLINNAIRYTEAGDEVKIEIKKDGKNEIKLSVIDSGKGIPLSEQVNIFDKFYKTTSSGRDGMGTALALPVVKSFIELHGGNIEIHSNPEEGTTITCSLKRHNRELLKYKKEKNVIEGETVE